MKRLDRTLNVGTYFYRSPEKQYDEKVDVYSLGVILLEMWYRFQNGHERVKVLGLLRNERNLPKQFESYHPR